ncbi:sensor domain-containing diguanylate cyclase [Kribbella catacumbae]|uniref:GGDEF domain-containing protein n=1 Tax=Kribbella catacumbae TaxID=460086 RepID=UPI0003765D3D|nr:GGDEF domain-containing protein [Kribbella catacumbae]
MISIRHRRPGRRRPDRSRALRNWELWTIPPVLLSYVLAVDALALAAPVLASGVDPIGSVDLVRFVALAVGSAVHIEAAKGIEKLRELAAEGLPYVNLKGMWTFAAVLLLPPPLAFALIVSTYLHSWLRLNRVRAYRLVFTTATVVLGSAAAALVLQALSPDGYPGFPSGPIGLAVLVLAGLAYWFVNYGLVIGAVLLSSPETKARDMLGRLTDHFVGLGSLGLGVAAAVLLLEQPWASPLLLVPVLGLQYGLLAGQFQTAARTDTKTGLVNAAFWHDMASKELERATSTNSPVSLLYVDLDYFKPINDTHGHDAGDKVLQTVAAELQQVLQAVATELQRATRADDLVGRLGGEEFAVLLPSTSPVDAAEIAERIRRRIEGLSVRVNSQAGQTEVIDNLTCSVGVATFPDAASTLQLLVEAADKAQYAAKDAGRNRIVVAPASSR